MAISYAGAGTDSLVAGPSANTPGLPFGLSSGDLLVVLHAQVSWVWSDGNTIPTTPSGWIRKHTASDSGNILRLTWFYRTYQPGMVAPSVANSGAATDTHFARVLAFRGAATGDPTDVLGVVSENATQTHLGPIAGVETTAAGGVVLVAGVREYDWASNGLATLSGDGLGWVEVVDRTDYALGDNIGVGLNYALTPNPTVVTPKTFTVNTGNQGRTLGHMWALAPFVPVVELDPQAGSFFALL